MFRPVHGVLLDALLTHPEGISVNALASLVKGRASRSIVLREVRRLAEMNLVRIVDDERHKQRKVIKPDRELADLSGRLEELRPLDLEDAGAKIQKMLLLLREVKRGSKSKHLIDYLKYRMREEFSRVLEVVA